MIVMNTQISGSIRGLEEQHIDRTKTNYCFSCASSEHRIGEAVEINYFDWILF